MKIAITGKGGVGKTTLSAILSHLYAKDGKKVIALDADPDANLASALGLKEEQISKIRPIAEMTELIAQRTGAKPGSMGGVFVLNPKVDDIPDACSFNVEGIKLLIMGKSKEASSGCYCPENVFLKRLLKHLVIEKHHVVIVDMEAGIEHLTRGTAEAVDAFVVVVEPGKRSIQTALTVREMAKGLGVRNVFVVASKVRDNNDINFIKQNIQDLELIGSVSFNQDIVQADIKGEPPYLHAHKAVEEIGVIKSAIEDKIK
ncbi:cobyrinic acid a,c-diamide synthase [Candidatus Magnetoovum chiemensis]|nr:cobyrinic acid a,c-diamide synthase [Candidatus Magnetoovum chiemensis]